MAAKKKNSTRPPAAAPQRTPPGATRRAFDRDLRPGEENDPAPDDRHAAGTPGGGTELGGLAGTNVADGAPDDVDLEEAAASGAHAPEAQEVMPPFAGASGGAVGGTPAEGRTRGGRTGGGLRPGGRPRGDSTVGADPEQAGTETEEGGR